MNYNLFKDNFTILRTKNNKLNFRCKHCSASLYKPAGININWEQWDIDVQAVLEHAESRALYHLLFKCKNGSCIIESK